MPTFESISQTATENLTPDEIEKTRQATHEMLKTLIELLAKHGLSAGMNGYLCAYMSCMGTLMANESFAEAAETQEHFLRAARNLVKAIEVRTPARVHADMAKVRK